MGRRRPGARRRRHGAGRRSRDRGRAHARNTRRSASTPSSSPATRTSRRPTASPSWCSRCCRSAQRPRRRRLAVNTGPFGETIANEHPPAARRAGRSVMTAAPIARRRAAAAWRHGRCRSALLVVWQVASSAGLVCRRACCRRRATSRVAFWQLLRSGELLAQHLRSAPARARRASPSAAASASCSGLLNGAVAARPRR